MKKWKVKVVQENGKSTSEYTAWRTMRERCSKQDHHAYKDYGGRGINVCDRWKNNFDNFIDDMGLKPTPKHTLDRVDNNKDYSPENCRWATMKEQCNNRRSCVFVEYNGEIKTLSQWADVLGIDVHKLMVNKKKSFEEKYLHYIKGGGQPSIKIEHNNQIKSIREWTNELIIGNRYLRKLLKTNSFTDIYLKYKKQ